jgi:NADP-dependent 3-hydroxy acid dehydrogenase YdfG
MSVRAALLTGASSGIGLVLARMPREEGHALTAAARRRGMRCAIPGMVDHRAGAAL